MRLLRRAGRLSSSDRRLIVRAAVLHTAVAIAVRVLPFRWARRVASCVASAGRRRFVAPVDEARVVWAVRTAAALARLGRTCLTEALAVHALLSAEGLSSIVRLGVIRAAGRAPLAAHAWVERGDRVVVGGETAGAYRVLESCAAMPARIANSTALAGIRRPVSHTL
jgi:transglutaminase superfamily protein